MSQIKIMKLNVLSPAEMRQLLGGVEPPKKEEKEKEKEAIREGRGSTGNVGGINPLH